MRPGPLVAALFLLTCCNAAQLRLAILPEQDATGQAAHKTGRHDLAAFARGLEKVGYAVSVISKLPEEGILELLASGPAPEDALFDAILCQGASLCFSWNPFILLENPSMSHISELLNDLYNMMATSLHAWCIPN